MGGWPLRRTQPRSVLSSVVVVSVSATLVVAALAAQGVPPTQAQLHDGGVWVTNASGSVYSRYIKQIRQQDTSAGVNSTSFDVVQNGPEVLLVETDKALLQAVDPVTVKVGATVVLRSSDTVVSLGGPDSSGTVAILDRPSGSLWLRPFNDLARLDLGKAKPNAVLGAGADVVVAADGSVDAASPAHREMLTFPSGSLDSSPLSTPTPPELSGSSLTITAVGATPVVLDPASGRVWLGGGRTEMLSAKPHQPVLQLAGPGSDSVLVADSTGLFEIPLSGGASQPYGPRVSDQGPRAPAAPVRVGACAFGAFVGSAHASQIRSCDGGPPTEMPLFNRAAGQLQAAGEIGSLRYRVNRGLVALNDALGGAVWDPLDKELVRVDSWQENQEKPLNQPQQGTTTTEPKCSRSTGPDHLPSASSLRVGARSGIPVVIDVMRSVSDADCDVVAIESPVVEGGAATGAVTLVGDGRTLQFTSAPAFSGSATIHYVADDGHTGGQTTGTVTVVVTADASNRPPTEPTKASTSVSQGGTVTYEVLGDFVDPDGDPLQLVGASVPGGQGTVQFTPDGAITYTDGGLAVGRVSVALAVTDGRSAPVSGTLAVNVRPRGDVDPTARNDYARTTVGVPVDVLPLANDSDANGDTLRLAAVGDSRPTGLHLRWDGTSGRVTAAASAPGSYLVDYTVAAGQGSAVGRLRVDVTDRAANRPPSPMVDLVGISVGSPAVVDVLANDIDPDNDVLAVTQGSAAESSGLVVSVDSNRFVRIQETRALTGPVLVDYVVTDGQYPVHGTVVVTQVESAATTQPPVAHPDTARVRLGSAVTIPVLANDTAPAGARLALASALVSEPTHGTAYVDGNTVRYLATSAGSDTFAYRAKDSLGDAVTGQVSVSVVSTTENSPPQPPPVVARVARGSSVDIPLQLDGIDPDGDAVMVSGVDPSQEFRNPVTVVDGSSVRYNASGSKLGTDDVSYTVCDVVAGSRCATGVVRVAVFDPGPDQPPTAVPDSIDVRPGKRVAVAVLANDTDPENDPIGFVPSHALDVPAGIDATVVGRTIEVVAPRTEGQFTITYRISDARHTATPSEGDLAVTVSADAPLLAPIAQDDYVGRDQVTNGTQALVDVLANDSDPDGTPADLSIRLVDPAAKAVVQGRQVLVTLDPTRPQLIPYQVIDPDKLVGTAFIVVPPGGNQPPHAIAGLKPLVVDAGKSIEIPLSDVAVDDDHGPQPMFLVGKQDVSATAGNAVPVNGTTISYSVPRDSQASGDVITAKVSDGQLTNDIQIPVTINAANRPPVFDPVTETVEVADVTPHVYQLAPSAHDPDAADQGKPIQFESVANRDVGGLTVSLQPDGTLTVTGTKAAKVGTQQRFEFGLTDARGMASLVKGYVILKVEATSKRPPVAVTDTVPRLDQGTSTTVDVVFNDVDPFKGQANAGLQLVPGSIKVSGPVEAVPVGNELKLTAPTGSSGVCKIQYSVKDAAGRVADGIVNVVIWAAPSAPGTPTEKQGKTTASTVTLDWAASTANSFSTDPNATTVSYTLSAYASGALVKSVDVPDTEATVTNLVPGTAYQFSVVAHNAVGDSPASRKSSPITPDAVPSTPQWVPYSPPKDGYDDGLVRLKWTQASYEGSALIGYQLKVVPAPSGAVDLSVSVGQNSKTVSGLTNGTQYSFVLCATNLKDTVCSDPAVETPTALPGTPTAVNLAAINDPAGGRFTASWSPGSDGGDSSVVYDVRLYNGSTVVDQKLGVSGLSVELNGQTGVQYTAGVIAHNRKGDSGEKRSQPAQSPAKPGAPTGLTATATGADGVVQLQFNAPASDGGTPIVGYQVQVQGNWTALAANKQVTGLSNGTTYTFAVRADNGSYTGDASNTVSAAPYGPPPTPSISTGKPSATQVSFSWSASSNGLPVTVSVTLNGVAKAGAGPGTGTYSNSLTAGTGYSQTYTLVVKSCDSKGHCSTPASATVTTDPQPPPPFYASVDKGPWNATYNGWYIHISIHNGRPNSLYGCQFSTSDGKYNGQWQRNIPTDGAGNGDNAAQYQAGTAWIWGGSGTVSVNCEGATASSPW